MNPGGIAATRGRFITVEGIEGVGKTTQMAAVASHLRQQDRAVLETREPGGTPLAERIRDLLLDPGEVGMPPLTELLLVFAARAVHLAEVIEPALASGVWVVCDRFTDASYAYQGGGRGIDPALIAQLEQLVQRDLRPDLTILLDAPIAAVASRREQRGVRDRFESEQRGFLQRVQESYRARARAEPQRVRIVDATADPATVTAHLVRELEDYIDKLPDKV